MAKRKKRVVGFRTVHVFDVAQTEGDDLPGFASVTGEPGYFIERVRSQIRDAGIELDTDYIESGALGVSSGGRITIRPGLNPAEEFSVLVHEFGHELLHRGERRQDTTKTIRETEAEAVAFAVCHRIGLETGSAARDYIQVVQRLSAKHFRNRCTTFGTAQPKYLMGSFRTAATKQRKVHLFEKLQ